MPVYLLVDNGSTRPGATMQLRRVAAQLSDACGKLIQPVSLQHADKIDPTDIEGMPAQTFTPFLDAQLLQGEREFIVLPLFFGVSRALTSFIPQQVSILQEKHGEFSLQVADILYPLPQGEPRLAELLHDHITQTAAQQKISPDNVVLVDHGSPVARVTKVRNNLADAVQKLLGDNAVLEQACMERREGSEYDFNGPLLEQWLTDKASQGERNAIVTLQFLLPGSHAGTGGDIEEICAGVMREYPSFNIAITPLIGEHPKLISILQSRLEGELHDVAD